MTDPQCVSVPVIDDDVLEDRETFIMELVKVDSSQDYKLEPFTVIAEIIDNESESLDTHTHTHTPYTCLYVHVCLYIRLVIMTLHMYVHSK